MMDVLAEPAVSVRGLVRRYGGREAVAGIDLQVRRGEIFAFLLQEPEPEPGLSVRTVSWLPLGR